MLYIIKNKATGEYFAGFQDGEVRWVALAHHAWRSDARTARAQADLFICNGIPAQRKVVAL